MKKSGFTLIELLLMISLMGILFTVGITNYTDFNRRQTVYQAARQIVQDLRLAQSLAANNQKPLPPSPCGTLDSYTFILNSVNKTYKIDINCSNPPYNSTFRDDFSPLLSDLTLSGFSTVKFKVLRQALECIPPPTPPSTSCELTVSGFGKSKKVIVGSGGAINIEGE